MFVVGNDTRVGQSCSVRRQFDQYARTGPTPNFVRVSFDAMQRNQVSDEGTGNALDAFLPQCCAKAIAKAASFFGDTGSEAPYISVSFLAPNRH